MYHRYGRYGPRAWLRWHKKHTAPPATSIFPVVRPITVRVFIPANAERIIFVVTTSPDDFDEIEDREDRRVVPSDPRNIQYVPEGDMGSPRQDDSDLIVNAQWQARKDAKEVKKLINDGYFVRIHQPNLNSRFENFVDEYQQENNPRKGPPPLSEQQRLINVYKHAYQRRFAEEMDSNQEKVRYLHTPMEAQIRDIAIQDRKTYASRQFHQRDLAVIQAIILLDLSLDLAKEHVEEIHTYADLYEKYYTNPRTEVDWPEKPF